MPAAVGELDLDGPGVADDVIIGGDEPGADEEAGADRGPFALARRRHDHRHGRLGTLGNLLDGLPLLGEWGRFFLGQLGLGGVGQTDGHEHEKKASSHDGSLVCGIRHVASTSVGSL